METLITRFRITSLPVRKLGLSVLLFLVFILPASSQSVKGYFPDYQMVPDAGNVQYSNLTDVIYIINCKSGNIYVDANGTIQTPNFSVFNAVKSKCTNINLYLSIQDAGDATVFPNLVKHAATFAANCANFCDSHGLTGIDIDWESWDSSDANNVSNFETLLSALRSALDSKGKGYKLSIAAPSYNAGNGIRLTAFKYIDYLNIMDYDDPLTAANGYNHSTLNLLQNMMTGWANIGVPYSKMVAGVPFYGKKIALGLTSIATFDQISGTNPLAALLTDSFNGWGYNGQQTIDAKIDYVMKKGGQGVFAWELTQDRTDVFSLISGMKTKVSSYANCFDANEPNDDTRTATPAFSSALTSTVKSVVLHGTIPDPSDQDWFAIPVSGNGTLTIDLSDLPADYDLELYPLSGLSGGALRGSYNTSGTAEHLTYTYTTPASTIFYVKLYPKNSGQSSACGKYTLTISWAPPSQAACTTPSAPTVTYGADVCAAPLVVSDVQHIGLTFTSNGGNSFGAQVSKYPYGSANIVSPTVCQSTTAAIQVTGLVAGMLYRWNMYAYGGTDCTSCQSAVSGTKYFAVPPVISAASAQLPATLTTTAQVPGSGTTVNYKWLKNGLVFQQGASLTSLSVNAAGTYTLIIEYSGSTNCSGTVATAASNALVVTAAIACTNSVIPQSLTQGVANTPNGQQVLLTVNGGSLGTNAIWRLYSGNCGGTLEGSGHANTFIVNPSVTTTYFLRAEGDCNTTDCVSTQVVVPCVNSVMPSAVTVSTANTPNGPTPLLTVVGGSLGTNAIWRVYSGSCGGTLEGSGHASTFLFNPAVTTTYYVRGEGDCNFTDCTTATIYVKPVIASFSPSSNTTGQTVTITGTNFTDASSVTFGGVPASLFTVNSPTSIMATVGSGANGNIVVTTPGGTASLSGFTYIFGLPATNFSVNTISATCKGSANGQVHISAAQHLNYTATLNGTSRAFTDSLTFIGLAAGTYNLCITVAGQSAYQQCYSLVVTEPKDLSVYIASIDPSHQAILNLSGGDVYYVTLNNQKTVTTNSQINLALSAGLNRITIATDKACQGTIQKDITVTASPVAYPNPFENILSVSLGTQLVRQVTATVFNLTGRNVHQQQFTNMAGAIQLDLTNLLSGPYILTLNADGIVTEFKILKK